MASCDNVYSYSCDPIYFTWSNGIDTKVFFRMMVKLTINAEEETVELEGFNSLFRVDRVSLDHRSNYVSTCVVAGEPLITYQDCNGVTQNTSQEFSNFVKCIQNCVAECCPIP